MCNKKKYERREDAIAVLWKAAKSKKHGNKKRQEKRVYHCFSCNAYHLTSKGDFESNTSYISKMYVNEVLYGKENRRLQELKRFDPDKACAKALTELYKMIDWRFYVERLKFEKKYGKSS